MPPFLFDGLPQLPLGSWSPWDSSSALQRQRRWMQLVELQKITLSWLQLAPEFTPPHSEKNPFVVPLKPAPWKDPLNTGFFHLFQPLESSLWIHQAQLLSFLISKNLLTSLKQRTYLLGQESAPFFFRQGPPFYFSALIHWLKDNPLIAPTNQTTGLIKRMSTRILQLRLLFCPHQQPALAANPHLDLLCGLHTLWSHGWASTLSSQLQVTLECMPRPSACIQTWTLTPTSS